MGSASVGRVAQETDTALAVEGRGGEVVEQRPHNRLVHEVQDVHHRLKPAVVLGSHLIASRGLDPGLVVPLPVVRGVIGDDVDRLALLDQGRDDMAAFAQI